MLVVLLSSFRLLPSRCGVAACLRFRSLSLRLTRINVQVPEYKQAAASEFMGRWLSNSDWQQMR